jgi:D-3-phosphoglycerate dehydrogenase / 2-oxoglutarate reductase
MTHKILSTSPSFGYFASEPLDYLKCHDCEWDLLPQGKKISQEELTDRIREADAIVVGMEEKITEGVLDAATKLKIITKHGAGVDNIDIPAATKKGIPVVSAAGANSDAVADLTMGLFLSLARTIPFADRSVKEGRWPRLVGIQINGKVLGIIGLGQIGKKVAKRATGFDMKVLSYDVVKDDVFARQCGIAYLPLEEVLAQSDFLSIHIPLNSSTRRLIGEKELRLMKKDSFLVNVSRGSIVDEEALCHALKEGRIRGAALDVFEQEPPGGSPLLKLDNFISTPHMAGYTREALIETGMICVRAIVDVLNGRRPQGVINREVLK